MVMVTVTSVTAQSSNDLRSTNVSVPVPASGVRSTASLVSLASAMTSNSPGTAVRNNTANSSVFGALSSLVSSTMSRQSSSTPAPAQNTSGAGQVTALGDGTTSQAVSSMTSPSQSKSTGNSASSPSFQQSSHPMSTPSQTQTPASIPPSPQQNGPSSNQSLVSTIHSTAVVTEALTDTSTSTLFPVSTLSRPVVVTEVAQNGSTAVITPSFVTVLTTSTNSDGSAVVWTGVYANPTADSSSQPETFFQNTGAVAGVFTVVGIVAALVVLCMTYLIRRSRRKRRQAGWLSAAAYPDQYGSPTMRSISSETPSDVSRSRVIFPTQDNARGYLPRIPIHVDIVQETEHYPSDQGQPLEAPINRQKMVSFTHNRVSSHSPTVPLLQESHRPPSESPFADPPVPIPKRLTLLRDNRPSYLPKISTSAEAGQVSRRLSIERQGDVPVSATKMVFPTRDNASSKRPSILVPIEAVRDSQRSSTEIKNVDSRKWKVRLPSSPPPTQQEKNKAVEETPSSSHSSPSIYPASLPHIESEDESTTRGSPSVEVKKLVVSPVRPHSAGAPPRPPRSALRSLSLKSPPSYDPLDSSTPSPSSSGTASPQAVRPRRTLLDVRPRSAPQSTPAQSRSVYQ